MENNMEREYAIDEYDMADAFADCGDALYELAKTKQDGYLFRGAIKEYIKAIELGTGNPRYSVSLADALYELAKVEQNEPLFDEAFKKYEEATQLEKNDSWSFVAYGDALYELAKIKQDESLFKKALANYDEAIRYDKNYYYAFIKRGIVLINLAEIKKATESFREAKKRILEIFVFLDKEEAEQIIETGVLYPLLNSGTYDGDFFNEATNNIKNISQEELNRYKKIYIISNFIISQLHINKKYETYVAHYAKKTTVEDILFNKSKFRLGAIDDSNDPTEGKTLFNYLFKNKLSKKKFNTEYKAFAGCFTFQHDSLNQFRLYGKDKNKKQEGTGLSLVFHENFFRKETNRLSKEDMFNEEDEEKKYTLFRCIYLDPKELDTKNQVKTVGQKETTDENYKKYINDVINIVNENIRKLKSLAYGLDENAIGHLIINLRYLTKHIAFKEEQECRIVDIRRITGKTQKYIEYEPDVISRIKKVYFGPKATNINSFQNRLKVNKLNDKIDCKKSENPFK